MVVLIPQQIFAGCKTTNGKECVFPFNFQGITHTECTTQGGYIPWCSTLTDSSGVHIIGNYGDCDMNSGLCSQSEEGITMSRQQSSKQ